MHYAYSNNLLNHNQFGFTPKKSTIDAVQAAKEYLEGTSEGHITIIVSLDVKGAFDAAWWPSILKALREFQCPKNLYNLAKSYFSERAATVSTNSKQIAREVTKGSPQGSYCGPGFWNIQFNSLLNLEFETKPKL